MNKLQVMNISGVDCYEKDGTAYLKLENVARGLGFTRIADSGNEVIRWERVNRYLNELNYVPTSGHDGFIPENVFYRLAMKAKNPVAEAFQAKVADEIIPSIRKHGAYIAGQETMTREQLMAKAMFAAKEIMDEQEKEINSLKEEKAQLIETTSIQAEQIAEMEPKATYYDIVLATKDLVSTTLISKDYGWTAAQMNKWLHDNGYQYKRGNTWVLYEKYAGRGYTSSKTHIYKDYYGSQHSSMHTYWTQAGRLFIYQELKKCGILPMVERETQTMVTV